MITNPASCFTNLELVVAVVVVVTRVEVDAITASSAWKCIFSKVRVGARYLESRKIPENIKN
jgi:hypothetical protein